MYYTVLQCEIQQDIALLLNAAKKKRLSVVFSARLSSLILQNMHYVVLVIQQSHTYLAGKTLRFKKKKNIKQSEHKKQVELLIAHATS